MKYQMKNFLSRITVAFSLLVAAQFAHATYTYTGSPDCGYITAFSTGFSPAYDACVGAYTNDNGNPETNMLSVLNTDMAFGDGTWTYLDKIESTTGTSPYFSVDAINNTSGTITFLQDFSNFDIVVGLKAATDFSLYEWLAPNNFSEITWNTSGTALNNKGEVQGLSHVSIYLRRHADVPEPGTLALLGLGLVGVGFARRRKS